MTFFLVVLLVALLFEYSNGFHDAANAIATVVSTKVLTPRQAIVLAAVCNLAGAFFGTQVAKTVGKGLIDTNTVTMTTVLAALLAAIAWNLLTWWLGLPSSSSHALVGGLCGAALATAHGQWSVLKWSITEANGAVDGIWPKVVLPMVTSPLLGFVLGMVLMLLLYVTFRRATPHLVNTTFGKLQLLSAAGMGFSHGSNDAQKTMGVITLALFTATQTHAFDHLPAWLGFLRTPAFAEIPDWVIIACALTMAAGTAAGGWRIIRTMGHKMVRLQPVNGFAAETTAGLVIIGASHFGIPLSTTHNISAAIMGVGATKRLSAVKWGVVERIVWAWVLTLPVTGLLGYLLVGLAHLLRGG
ncbi:MAG TPA: inorganic phosphate transporter [Opitutaceae bacterium]|nr:inorganic phosphate transporter [Opitutaceae bacterium]HUJ42848.1 inorganic phosphate transporter [Opitutaceae bacterium]